MKDNSLIKNALILGLMTAMGPFAIDMYLPALPAIENVLGQGAVLSLTAFFLSFGIFQLIFGTLSDMYGRRGPLLAGLGLFVLAGAGCAMTSSVGGLVAFRFLQGIGGAAGIIIARAIVRDLYEGHQEIRMMSLLMLVFSVSPLLAPLAGSYVVEYLGWRAVFWSIAASGVLGIVLMLLALSETLPQGKRIRGGFAGVKQALAVLASDKSFVGMTLIGAFGITTFFIYLGSSSFVMMDYYGLSTREFSLAFSANALAFFAAAQGNSYLSKRFWHAPDRPARYGGVCGLHDRDGDLRRDGHDIAAADAGPDVRRLRISRDHHPYNFGSLAGASWRYRGDSGIHHEYGPVDDRCRRHRHQQPVHQRHALSHGGGDGGQRPADLRLYAVGVPAATQSRYSGIKKRPRKGPFKLLRQTEITSVRLSHRQLPASSSALQLQPCCYACFDFPCYRLQPDLLPLSGPDQ
jgi:Bcr/CflA subfamily drug resistance transporter